MLAPVLDWRPDVAPPGLPVSLKIGRGQIVGAAGPEWETLARVIAGKSRIHRFEGDAPAPEQLAALRDGNAALSVVAFTGAPSSETLALVMEALEARASAGAGALVTAPDLPDDPGFSRRFALPGEPAASAGARLVDDAGHPVRCLRQGEWGALEIPLSGVDLDECEQVRLEWSAADGTRMASPPEALLPWQAFCPRPRLALPRFAAPGAPGIYLAEAVFTGRGLREPLRIPAGGIEIRPSSVNAPVDELRPAWRFTGAQAVTSEFAAFNLRNPARVRFTPGVDDRHGGLMGWHPAEPTGGGGWQRWSMGHSGFIHSGERPWASLRVLDQRPRIANVPARTTVRVLIDGRLVEQAQWEHPGEHRLGFPWPADGLNHWVEMVIDPEWSPQEYGLVPDPRRFGVLLLDEARKSAPVSKAAKSPPLAARPAQAAAKAPPAPARRGVR